MGLSVILMSSLDPRFLLMNHCREFTAWISVAVVGNETRAVIASLLGEPGVATLHDTN